MKCTDFRKDLEAINKKEVEELKKALEAHGGEYEFADGEEKDMDDLENYPEVVVYDEYHWFSFVVMKAGIGEDGAPYLSGKAREESAGYYMYEYISELPADKVKVGDVLFIISMMDEPE